MKTKKIGKNVTSEERYKAYRDNLLHNSPEFPSHKWKELDPVILSITHLPFSDCLGSWDEQDECVEVLLYFNSGEENEKRVSINKFIFEDDPEDESRILSFYIYKKRDEEERKQYPNPWKIGDVYFGEIDKIVEIVEKHLKDEI